MLTVIESPDFTVDARKIWSSQENEEFVDYIAANPHAGDVVPGSNGCRKVRWGRAGMGKRGGVRVVYFCRPARGELVLMMIYTKGEQDNVSPVVLAKLKEILDV